MLNQPYLLTEDGVNRLSDELTKLKTEGRERLAERLQRALEDGQDDDFVDNAELDAARHEQSFLEGRIQELETILANYKLIGDLDVKKSIIGVGAKITVVELGFEDEEETYHLVGPAEADPVEGRISNESPLGKALLGKKKGQTVTISAPNGEIEFKIIKIKY